MFTINLFLSQLYIDNQAKAHLLCAIIRSFKNNVDIYTIIKKTLSSSVMIGRLRLRFRISNRRFISFRMNLTCCITQNLVLERKKFDEVRAENGVNCSIKKEPLVISMTLLPLARKIK